MGISNFFSSPAGMYVAQAFSHSLIAALVVDRAIQAWGISSPVVRQRFSLIVILFPIVSFPLYQMINPERGSLSFRLETLFDINRWLNLEIWGIIPVNLLFLLMLIVTTLIFLFQEMIPVVKHTIETRESDSPEEEEALDHPGVRRALENFPGEKPRVSILDDDEFILFSTTGKMPTVFLSSGLVERLDTEELQAAIAHEIAHIARNRRPLLVVVFLTRILMFFNPVVLVEFRRMVQEEEKICDDIAVSLTRKPRALAEILKKFNHAREKLGLDKMKELSKLGTALQDYSHNVHLESRIRRLEEGTTHGGSGQWIKFLLTLIVIGIINYFVV
jgi:Zn-dependent protease with chaperone function